jgi:hypothetical protein
MLFRTFYHFSQPFPEKINAKQKLFLILSLGPVVQKPISLTLG